MKKLLIISVLVFSCAAFAQRPHVDPRPLKSGFDASKIPVITDWKAFLEKCKGNSLTKNAVTIATTTKTPMPLLNKEEITLEPMHSDKTKGMWKVLRADNGTVNWMWLVRTKKGNTQTSQSIKPEAKDALAILQTYNRTLKLDDPKSELVLMSDERDEVGKRHVRYAQYYKGLPMWNKDLYVHFDAENEVSVINGTYEPTPLVSNVTAAIDKSSAITAVISDLKTQNIWAPIPSDVAATINYSGPSATLLLYPENGKTTLAYSVELYANLYESYEYLVDASNGTLLHRIAKFCSVAPVDHSVKPLQLSGMASLEKSALHSQMPMSVGFTGGSGIDLNGVNQNFRCYEHSDGKFYSIWDLPDIDMGKSQLPNSVVGGAITLTVQNKDLDQNAELFHIMSSSSTFTDKSGIDAMINMKKSYDYYANTFTRMAIDGKNSLIISVIHATEGGQPMDNAFWNGSMMVYGDGQTSYKPLAGGLDVGGHEITHGVIGNSANLIYEFQSGALNESFADVFAVMIDAANLTVGEQVMQPGQGSFLRDLENPANPAGHNPQPDHMNVFKNLTINQDNGGVHINSGIPNRACAIIINALGRDKAQKIYYTALTKYLTRNSQFIDCRHACEQAAKDLNLTSAEQTTVSNAFATVGIGEGTSNGDDNNVKGQTGGIELIAFITGTGQIGVMDGTGAAGLYSNPAAFARITNPDFRAQLSTPRNGSAIWFVSATGKLSYIEKPTDGTSVVKEYPTLNLGQNGDLWNAAISPDNNFVAITSAYPNDPNIYIFDGTNIFKLPLTVETGDGSGLQTIQYPDVIRWSPNMSIPRVGLDAFNEVSIAGTTYGYWSMYEMNFESKRCYDLIPAQPKGVDIGNIIYGNTDPDLIAFNVIENGVWDVVLANFQKGFVVELGLNKWSINGSPIIDAEKPTFKPNDGVIAFSSPANKTIGFYSQPGGTATVTILSFTTPLYNPYWFLSGGAADVKSEAEISPVRIIGAYPATFDNELTISFENAKPLDISCELLNILGETVQQVTSEKYESGMHALTLRKNDLAAGVYFVRLSANGVEQTVKVVKK